MKGLCVLHKSHVYPSIGFVVSQPIHHKRCTFGKFDLSVDIQCATKVWANCQHVWNKQDRMFHWRLRKYLVPVPSLSMSGWTVHSATLYWYRSTMKVKRIVQIEAEASWNSCIHTLQTLPLWRRELPYKAQKQTFREHNANSQLMQMSSKFWNGWNAIAYRGILTTTWDFKFSVQAKRWSMKYHIRSENNNTTEIHMPMWLSLTWRI